MSHFTSEARLMRMIYRLLALLLVASPAMALTEVGGIIGSDQRWTMAGSPYVVMSSLLVEEGRTLSIDPGVLVLFQPGTGMTVRGALVAHGSADSVVTFASGTFPQSAADWKGITLTASSSTTFDSSAQRTGGSLVRYALFRHAERALDLIGGGFLVERCVFEENREAINLLNTHTAIIRENTFRENVARSISSEGSPTEGARELYDTRIIGNTFDGPNDGSVSIAHPRLSWVEVAHNQLRSQYGSVIIEGMIPEDVQSVRVHHNLFATAIAGLILSVRIERDRGSEGTAHALVDRNVFAASIPRDPMTGQRGLTIGSDVWTRIAVTRNTLADWYFALIVVGSGHRTIAYNTFARNAIVLRTAPSTMPDTVPTSMMFNTFAYTVKSIALIAEGLRYDLRANDMLPSGEVAIEVDGPDTVSADGSWWGERAIDVAGRIRGAVSYRSPAPRGFFSGPLVPPHSVHAAIQSDGALVWWSPSPDPRADGYRVWYNRRADGFYESWIDVQDTIAHVPDGRRFAGYAVTAFNAGARGLLDQLEGRESWFARPEDIGTSSVDAWHAPLRLDLR
jgi:hypothetical protein